MASVRIAPRRLRVALLIVIALVLPLGHRAEAAEVNWRGAVNDPACLPDPASTARYPDYCRTDASGNRLPSETTYDESRVEIRHVPADGQTIVTRLSFAPDRTYTIQVEGAIDYHFGRADAECTTGGLAPLTLQDTTWRAHRWDHTVTPMRDRMDLTVLYPDGTSAIRDGAWIAEIPHRGLLPIGTAGEVDCSENNRYHAEFTPGVHADGREHLYPQDLRIAIDGAGLARAGGSGYLTVKIFESGSSFTPEGEPIGKPFRSKRVMNGAAYQCPKLVETPVQNTPDGVAGEIQTATLHVDPRHNFFELGADKNQSWEQAGNFGIYTCNWLMPGSSYFIIAKGTYQYVAGAATNDKAATGCLRTGDDTWFREHCDDQDWWQCTPTPATLPGQQWPDPSRTCVYLDPAAGPAERAAVDLKPAFADAECAQSPHPGGDSHWKFDRVRGGGRPVGQSFDSQGRPVGGDYDTQGNPLPGPRPGESTAIAGGPAVPPTSPGWFQPGVGAVEPWRAVGNSYWDMFDLHVGSETHPLRNWVPRLDAQGKPVRDAWGNPIADYTFVEWNPAPGTEFPRDPKLPAGAPNPQERCSKTHTYCVMNWSPEIAGPMHSVIRDFAYRELFNDGHLTLTVKRLGVRRDIPRYQDWCRDGTGWRLGEDKTLDGLCD